jgi:Ca2+-binding RTX toxin-like protein
MRGTIASVASAVLLLAVPGVAMGGDVSGTGNSFFYLDAAAQTNDLVVTRSGTTLVFTDPATMTESSTQCDPPTMGGTQVTCTMTTADFGILSLTMGGGDDGGDASGAADMSVIASGGSGEDDLVSSPVGGSLSGDADNDTLEGGAGTEALTGGEGNDGLSGGGGFDILVGSDGNDDLQGGDNSDVVDGGPGADTASGGAQDAGSGCGDTLKLEDKTVDLVISFDGAANDTVGDGDTFTDDFESIVGGNGNDRLTGNDAMNCLTGDDGDDVLVGLGGEDSLDGSAGRDTADGGTGDDDLTGDYPSAVAGGEVFIGGEGIDRVSLTSSACDSGGGNCSPRPVTITLDDQPNDGADGEGDDVRSDVEDVSVFGQFLSPPEQVGAANVTGSATFNVIGTSQGNDTVDPGGGSDSVSTSTGDDTINARDGFSDRIDCDDGNDTANVDQLDIVVSCEIVNRETVPVALEDRPPTVTFAPPATIDPATATTLRAEAADDRGVQRVLFMDDERTVCNDDAAPFECPYQPRGEDAGRNTLIAVAIDTGEQAAFSAHPSAVSRFRATRLTIAFRRGRASGRLTLPAALTSALGCRGTVTIRVRRGRRVVRARRVRLARTCRYRIRIRARRGTRIQARFGGNAVVLARSSRALRMRRR